MRIVEIANALTAFMATDGEDSTVNLINTSWAMKPHTPQRKRQNESIFWQNKILKRLKTTPYLRNGARPTLEGILRHNIEAEPK